MNLTDEVRTLGHRAYMACSRARKAADQLFFYRHGYYCQWPLGSVLDRKEWIQIYHAKKRHLMRAS